MNRRLAFLFIFWSVILYSQDNPIPHLSSDGGKIQIFTQSLEVNVVGEVSDVRLYQTFKVHDTKSAYYLFPVGVETSLYELMVYYPDKIFSLDVRNMDNIRKQVLAENKKGKRITLMHSSESQYVRLNLPNIPEDEVIKVVVKYSQNLEKSAEKKSLEIPAYLSGNYEDLLDEFSFRINIISPTAVYDAEIRNYPAELKKVSSKYQVFNYKGNIKNQPILLNYHSRGEKADAGMLVYEDKGCRYILGVVEPPKVIKPEDIAPREYVFLMDVSGSMQGFPIETSKELVKRILNDLNPEEKFNILFFAGGS